MTTTAFAAGLVFGFANGLHCAGMCSPLAAGFLDSLRGVLLYHLGRLLAYALVGLLAGGLGNLLGTGRLIGQGPWLSFVLAAIMLLLALGLDRGLGKLGLLSGLLAKLLAGTRKWRAGTRGLLVGLLTPLLPCGLLYAAYAAALATGSALGGASSMSGFALGGIPILGFAQGNLHWLHRKLGPKGMQRTQRVLLLLAALLLLWRGWRGLAESPCH